MKYYGNGRYIATQKSPRFMQMVVTCCHQRNNDTDFSTAKSTPDTAQPSDGTNCIYRFVGYQQDSVGFARTGFSALAP